MTFKAIVQFWPAMLSQRASVVENIVGSVAEYRRRPPMHFVSPASCFVDVLPVRWSSINNFNRPAPAHMTA
jgi:hypothetical protein